MKKFLLTLAAIVSLGFAANAVAPEVTESFAKNDGEWYTTEKADADKKTELTSTNTGITYNSEQVYRNADGYLMLIKNKGVIKFKLDFACTKITIYSKANASGSQKVQVLAGDATIQESISLPNKADGNIAVTVPTESQAIGTEYTIKGSGANVQITKIVYTGVDEGKQEAVLSFPESAYTVTQGETFEKPVLTCNSDGAVTYTSSDAEVAAVDAATGDITLGTKLGTTTITATSAKTDTYYGGKAYYTLTVVKKYAKVAEFYTLPKGGKGIVGFELTVAYVKGSNVYATTGEEWTLVYGYNLGYKEGDVIPAGWMGEFSPYNGLPEIKPAGEMPTATQTGQVVTIKDATAVTLDMINQIVVLKGVTFAAATLGDSSSDFDGKIGETTIKFRNSNEVASVEAGTYDVKCIIGYFEKNSETATDAASLQVVPISYTAVESTGIDEIGVGENAAVEYYNLQGVRVANPENGLFIRRQGNKVAKVYVK